MLQFRVGISRRRGRVGSRTVVSTETTNTDTMLIMADTGPLCHNPPVNHDALCLHQTGNPMVDLYCCKTRIVSRASDDKVALSRFLRTKQSNRALQLAENASAEPYRQDGSSGKRHAQGIRPCYTRPNLM
jgi:hypothetical protein